MPELEIGVDEAGRGAVLGPLVLAACALSPDTAATLARLGVADSKSYGAPARAQSIRSALASEIVLRAEWYGFRVLSAHEVDVAVERGQLNLLERTAAEELLTEAPAWKTVILDGEKLFGLLAARLPGGVALNRAEEASLAVAAASILAKAERDRLFSSIRAQHEARFGPIRGEGYPNAATARFLDRFLREEGDLPPETRRSWSWPPVARHRGSGPGPISFDFDEDETEEHSNSEREEKPTGENRKHRARSGKSSRGQ